jgi:hypothetical protein
MKRENGEQSSVNSINATHKKLLAIVFAFAMVFGSVFILSSCGGGSSSSEGSEGFILPLTREGEAWDEAFANAGLNDLPKYFDSEGHRIEGEVLICEETVTFGVDPYDYNGTIITFNPSQIVWTSSDESVATVKDGVITGISPGVARINVVATSEAGHGFNDFSVTVIEQPFYFTPASGKGLSDKIDNGYIAHLDFNSWYGVLGTDNILAHPASGDSDNKLMIPATDNKTLVIPFQVVIRNMSGFDFNCDLNITAHYSGYSGSNSPNIYIYEEESSRWTELGSSIFDRVAYDAPMLSPATLYGYMIVPNIITPASRTPELNNLSETTIQSELQFRSPISDKGAGFTLFQDDKGISLRYGVFSGGSFSDAADWNVTYRW